MSEPATAIERRDTDALSKILGTGDVQLMLERSERNVKAVIEVARARGFVQRYGGSQHEFFGFPAWSLLAMAYGLTPKIEWTRKVDDGWEARAVVRTRDGEEIAAAEAMCTTTERNRRNADPHTLRAMSQTRAMRNALRSCLGAALVLSGFDFADPEGPATKEQVGLLHQLERELGWSHEEGHARAGEIDSYKELTREEASLLIERWTALRDGSPGEGRGTSIPHSPGTDVEGAVSSSLSGGPPESDVSQSEAGASDRGAPEDKATLAYGEGAASTSSGAPTLDELWKQAAAEGLTATKAKAVAKGLGFNVKSATELDVEQMQRVLKAAGKRKG